MASVPATIDIPVVRLEHARDLELPRPATAGAAGLDLRAAIAVPLALAPLSRVLVPTGLVLALPTGYEGQVRPRSGLALDHGLTVLNAPGTIDSDYRGELLVLLVNLGQERVVIERGQRIAQLVIAPVVRARLVERLVEQPVEAPSSENHSAAPGRHTGGFGSTGR